MDSPERSKCSEGSSDDQNIDTFDWSVSNITTASGFKPDILDSHVWATPSRLDPLKEKPASFFKLSYEEAGDEEESEFGTSQRKSTGEKDSKLEMLRNTVKHLEEFHHLKSHSPRKLKNDSHHFDSGLEIRKSKFNSSSSSSSNNTTIKNQTRSERRDHNEIYSNSSTQNFQVTSLANAEAKISCLEKANSSLLLKRNKMEALLNEKSACIEKVKNQCEEIKMKWVEESSHLNNEISYKLEEIKSLKSQNSELDKKMSIYEKELEKALALASDFKSKIVEDEEQREKLLEEVISERTLKSHELSDERKKVSQLTMKNSSLLTELRARTANFKVEISNLQEGYQSEKNEIEKRLKKVQEENSKLTEQLKKNETSVHEFYQKQMESILSEKLKQLRCYIQELEKNMKEENDKIIQDLKKEHENKVSILKDKYVHEMRKLMLSFDVERSSLNSSLEVLRKEADTLREHVVTHSWKEPYSKDEDNSTSISSPISTSKAILQKVQSASEDALSSSSSFARRPDAAELSSSALKDDISLLTESEKERIIKAYIQRFMKENPGSVSDASLMSGLNDMLYDLVLKNPDSKK